MSKSGIINVNLITWFPDLSSVAKDAHATDLLRGGNKTKYIKHLQRATPRQHPVNGPSENSVMYIKQQTMHIH